MGGFSGVRRLFPVERTATEAKCGEAAKLGFLDAGMLGCWVAAQVGQGRGNTRELGEYGRDGGPKLVT